MNIVDKLEQKTYEKKVVNQKPFETYKIQVYQPSNIYGKCKEDEIPCLDRNCYFMIYQRTFFTDVWYLPAIPGVHTCIVCHLLRSCKITFMDIKIANDHTIDLSIG